MHKFIAEQLQTGRVPLCINPQSAAFKSFARWVEECLANVTKWVSLPPPFKLFPPLHAVLSLPQKKIKTFYKFNTFSQNCKPFLFF